MNASAGISTPSSRRPAIARIELAAALHAGALLVLASWLFGGNIAWARPILSVFGSVGIVLTLAAAPRRHESAGNLRPLHFLWPLLGYDILVAISALQPAFQSGIIDGSPVLVPIASLTSWPCSAQPAESLRQLWLFNALFFPAFNLLFCVRTRRVLRHLLVVVTGNALALAVFGSLQKLIGATGLFFGAFASPNKTFFASFIYHNHWGAFVVLMLAATLGLSVHFALRGIARNLWHSPVFLGLASALLLAAAAPLSTSRSATILSALLLGIAFVDALRRLAHLPRASKTMRTASMLALFTGAALAISAIYVLARPAITARADDTRQQLAAIQSSDGLDSRAQLYADTWRMARDRPLFGWGLGSYPVVFQRYNTQVSRDGLPVYYVDAHSDWLQSLAETGFVGTAFIGLLVLSPAVLALRRKPGPLPAYLLGGCALILLYAWIEFPFGCPAVLAAFWLVLFSAARLAQLDTHDRPSKETLINSSELREAPSDCS